VVSVEESPLRNLCVLRVSAVNVCKHTHRGAAEHAELTRRVKRKHDSGLVNRHLGWYPALEVEVLVSGN
jgi:hypothetical protein